MSFYKSIVDNYDNIFPLNRVQVDFIGRAFTTTEKLALLDIGCGTGSLSIELDKLFNKVTALDLDAAMLQKAMEKDPGNINWKILDMLSIENEFGNNTFDVVVCFGNTLVHLDGKSEILDFFKQSKAVLREEGKLLFQIINYDRIIDKQINALPTIENEHIRFVREYTYHPNINSLDFITNMLIKETGEEVKNVIKLYPIRKAEIDELLELAGFSNWQYFGNFKRGSLLMESQPLICEVQN